MSPEVMVIVAFLGIIAGILIGIPVATVLPSIGLLLGLLLIGPRALDLMMRGIWAVVVNEVLVALPLFIFMGCMLQTSGVADKLFHNLRIALGGLRGGLGIVVIILATVLAATTGIIGTAVVMMGVLAMPTMLAAKYNRPLAAGLVCAGGTLGILIPPSIMLILYSLSAGISVVSLFAGAVIPGLLLSTLYILYVAIRCYLRPELGPPVSRSERETVMTARFLPELLWSLIPPLVLIGGVLGTIFLGVATPTEAAGTGAFTTVVLSVLLRKFSLKALTEAARETVNISATILWLVAGAQMFTSIFLFEGGGDVVKGWVMGLAGGHSAVVLSVMMVALFVLGKLICWVGILLITVPLFVPIAIAMGWDPLWFGLLVCVNLQMSFLTPPFAYAIFYLKQVAPPEVTLWDIYRGVWPFIGLQAVGLLLIIVFPQLVLWLPGLLLR
jgi:tripartite ATP-independent transporter DctM subunit